MRQNGLLSGVRLVAVAFAAGIVAWSVGLTTPAVASADSNCTVTQGSSINSDAASTITFTNGTSDRTVHTDWLSYDGLIRYADLSLDVPYATLGPGAAYTQDTFVTHPWKTIDARSGECLGYVLSSQAQQSYTVQQPPGPTITDEPSTSADGPASVGQTLNVFPGTYNAGNDPITGHSYQWARCFNQYVESCTPLAGQTGLTYTVAGGDAGLWVHVTETVTTLSGATVIGGSALVHVLGADLASALQCTTNCPANVGAATTITGTFSNLGPDDATNVFAKVTPTFDAGVTASVQTVTIGNTVCNLDSPSYFCSLGTVPAATSLPVSVIVTPTGAATLPAQFHVTLSVVASGVADPNAKNDSRTVDVSIAPGVVSGVTVFRNSDQTNTIPGASAIPTKNIDLAALPTGFGSTASAPIASVPIASVPIASVPIASVPIASVPIASVGLTPELLDSIGGVPLSSVPLSTAGGWDARLLNTPLAGSMLQTVTLADVLRQAPSAINGLTIADINLASSPIASVPIASVALGPLHLSDIPLLGNTGAQNNTDWCTALANAGFACDSSTQKLGDGTSVGNATLMSIGIEGAPIASVPIASVPIASIPIASVPIASVPIASIAVAGSPIASVPIASVAVAGSPIASVPIASIPIASVANVVDCSGGYPCNTKTLGDALIDHRILPTATLADLGNAILSGITLGQLGPFFPPNITLGDVLAALAGPASSRAYEQLPFTQLPAQAWDPNGAKLAITYSVGFTLTGGPSPGGVTVAVQPPPGFRYFGGATFNDAGTSTAVGAPDVTQGGLRFHVTATPGDALQLNVPLRPSLVLGGSGPMGATVTPDGGDPASGSGGDIAVIKNPLFSPADNQTPPTIAKDTVYLSHITSATDVDTFLFPAPPAGSHVTVKLVPPKGADYDLALARPARSSVLSAPIASVPLDGQPVPDTGVPLSHASSSLAPETLSDIPIASVPIASVSDNRGSAEEVATAITQPGDAGQNMQIQVSGYQGSTSTSPYSLLVTVTPPPDLGNCSPSPIVTTGLTPLGTLPAVSSTPTTLNTLFVVDSRRLQAAYGLGPAQNVMSALSTLAGRGDLGVTGAVLDVSNDSAVTTAETTWDANPCLPDNANAVGRAITDVVSRYTSARPSAKYIVLVGGDDQIPFFRLPDLTTVSNEADYAATFLDHPNQYYGSMASGDVLSDNPYGTTNPTPFFDRYLYVPSLSVGRLVETPGDIVNAVTQFTGSGGKLSPSTALVTGYDFLADGSHQVADTETAQRGAANVKSLIDDPGSTTPPWTAASLDTALGSSPATVLSLNAHYDHYRLLPSDRGTLYNSSQMAAKSLTGRYVFTMGCHAGLSVSDIIVGASDSRRLDWAQVYGAGGALFTGNTGFGYGDTTAVAYSEKLMSLLAKRLDGSMSAGDALTFAKNDFKASLGPLDVYDEKVISETTFYGLPMYKVGNAVSLPTLPAPRPTAPDTTVGGGVVEADLNVSPTLTQKSSPFGSYFASDDTVAVNYRPVEPSTSTDVTEPNLVAHGALITQLASTDIGNFDAAFSMPTIDRTATSPEPVFGDTVFPTKIQTIETYADPRGQRQRLVLVAGQFASDPSLQAGRGRQRNFTQIGARVYYAPPGVTDFTPAQFGLVEGAQIGSQAAFSVHVGDGSGTGVKRVLVGYHDGSAWKFVDLQQSSADSTLWTGGGATSTPNPEFFVQAVDGAGNVSVTSYKGRYYLTPTPPASGSNGVTWTLSGTQGANGWFTSGVTATVTAPAGVPLSLDGGPFTQSSPLTVTGDGLHFVGVLAGGSVTQIAVPIDASKPTISITSPTNGSTPSYGDGTKLQFACADGGSGIASCTATLNGAPVANGADVSKVVGANTVVVTATDAAGNTATSSVTFEVHWAFSGFFQPIDNPPTLNVMKPGQAIPVKFSLGGNQGLAIFAAGYPAMETINCASSAPLDPVEQTVTAGGSSLTYDSGANQYTYVWKTPSSGWPSGACRQLVLKLVDGSKHVAYFKAK